MAVEVRKKEKETTASLLRRFSRRVQQSGILLRARRARFYEPQKSKRQKRIDALRRFTMQKEREKLIKLGKIEERRR